MCDGLVGLATISRRLHLRDRDGKLTNGLAVDVHLEAVHAVRREAHVVELDDHVHVLAGRGVHADLGRVRHGLLAVGTEQPDNDRMRPDVEAQDRDEEHARMLRRQPAHADIAEDAEQTHLAVLSDERVVAQGAETDLRGHRVTILTKRSATTMTFFGEAPASAARTFGLARAALRSASSEEPAGATIRPRSLPFTCTTMVSSAGAAISSSYVGQRCWCTEPWPPRLCQSSSVMCGAKGASSRTIVAMPSSRLGPAPFCSAFESSIIAATAVLNEYVRTSSFNTAVAAMMELSNARSEEHTSELQSPYDLVC